MIHYSHLYATRDIVDLAISLVKHSGSTNFKERMDRINRIKNIFSSDMGSARELAWVRSTSYHITYSLPFANMLILQHAGQILAAGRRFGLHTSSDCLRVFIAGVYLYAFARYFPFRSSLPSVAEEHAVSLPSDVVKLDSLASSPTNENIRYWIKHGGRARLEHIDDLYTIEGAREVLRLVESLLQRMKLWGICEKFLKVVQEILQTGP